MWKATATLDQNAVTAAKQVKSEDDEWDSGNAKDLIQIPRL
jgi:hypothetical protein